MFVLGRIWNYTINLVITHYEIITRQNKTMKTLITLTAFSIIILFSDCSRHKYEKGFSVSPETETTDEDRVDGISKDSVNLPTRPSTVLLTGFPEYRLTTIYKLNYDRKNDSYFIGSDNYYQTYSGDETINGNQWHYNFMPGLEAVYGFNMVNVSLYNVTTKKQKYFFDNPVLIKTLYFPSFTSDTLNYKPVKRDFYMISVYDEDTNKDGFINLKDLRRFYSFNLEGMNKKELLPRNYSIISSEYDSANDYMYVFAQLDENNNGQREEKENIHVFWIDLKNPANNGRQY